MKELAMLNHLKYWPFIFRYSSLTCIKFHLIVSKLDPLDSRNKMMLIKLSFILTPNIKHLFCVILLAFMIFLALVVLGITFSKQSVLYEKAVEYAWTDNNSIVYKHFDNWTSVQNLFDTVYLHSPLSTWSSFFQNSDKFDLRIVHINLTQDNVEITDGDKNWNTRLFKKALKTKELNPILNSE